jgi:hypothetical protein
MKSFERNQKMKRILIYFSLTLAMLCSMGCQKEAAKRTYFSTPQEAANKAKNDLLTVLRSRKEIALGLEEPTIEKSQPANPIRQYQITFEDLAAADSFTALQRNELATVMPLVADGAVATIVAVAKEEAGWKIVSLADKSLSSELDVVRKAAGQQVAMVIYNLPHSGEKVYAAMQPVTAGAGTALYTNYEGFNLREPASAERLLSRTQRNFSESTATTSSVRGWCGKQSLPEWAAWAKNAIGHTIKPLFNFALCGGPLLHFCFWLLLSAHRRTPRLTRRCGWWARNLAAAR